MDLDVEEVRELCSECTKTGLAAARARDRTLGGNRGGPKVDPAKGRAARSKLADEYARDVGRLAFNIWWEGGVQHSYSHVAAFMEANGVGLPQGGKWSRDAVRRLLQRYMSMDQ
jgi:DNA invertase Pin-like site-specific DNA recombinase